MLERAPQAREQRLLQREDEDRGLRRGEALLGSRSREGGENAGDRGPSRLANVAERPAGQRLAQRPEKFRRLLADLRIANEMARRVDALPSSRNQSSSRSVWCVVMVSRRTVVD